MGIGMYDDDMQYLPGTFSPQDQSLLNAAQAQTPEQLAQYRQEEAAKKDAVAATAAAAPNAPLPTLQDPNPRVQEPPQFGQLDALMTAAGPVVPTKAARVARADYRPEQAALAARDRGAALERKGTVGEMERDAVLKHDEAVAGGTQGQFLADEAEAAKQRAINLQNRLQQWEVDHDNKIRAFEEQSKNMNPYSRFTRNVGTTVLSSLALVLGSAGDAIQGSDKFAKMWDSELNREFEVQKQKLQDKRYALSDSAQQFYRITAGAKSDEEARNAYKQAMTQSYNQNLQNLRDSAESDKVTKRIDAVTGRLDQAAADYKFKAATDRRDNETKLDLTQAQLQQQANNATALAQNHRGDLAMTAGASLFRGKGGEGAHYVPGFVNPDTGQPIPLSKEQVNGEHGIERWAGYVRDSKTAIGKMRQLIQESGGSMSPDLDKRYQDKMEALARTILSLKSQVSGAGVPTNKELDDAAAQIKGGGRWGSDTSVVDFLESAIDDIANARMRGYSNPGVSLTYRAPQEAKK